MGFTDGMSDREKENVKAAMLFGLLFAYCLFLWWEDHKRNPDNWSIHSRETLEKMATEKEEKAERALKEKAGKKQ